MDIFEKTIAFGHKRGVKDIENQIKKCIRKRRLAFLPNNQYSYTDKKGIKGTYYINDMVKKMIEVGKWENNMVTLGIADSEVKEILEKEYKKETS